MKKKKKKHRVSKEYNGKRVYKKSRVRYVYAQYYDRDAVKLSRVRNPSECLEFFHVTLDGPCEPDNILFSAQLFIRGGTSNVLFFFFLVRLAAKSGGCCSVPSRPCLLYTFTQPGSFWQALSDTFYG